MLLHPLPNPLNMSLHIRLTPLHNNPQYNGPLLIVMLLSVKCRMVTGEVGSSEVVVDLLGFINKYLRHGPVLKQTDNLNLVHVGSHLVDSAQEDALQRELLCPVGSALDQRNLGGCAGAQFPLYSVALVELLVRNRTHYSLFLSLLNEAKAKIININSNYKSWTLNIGKVHSVNFNNKSFLSYLIFI